MSKQTCGGTGEVLDRATFEDPDPIGFHLCPGCPECPCKKCGGKDTISSKSGRQVENIGPCLYCKPKRSVCDEFGHSYDCPHSEVEPTKPSEPERDYKALYFELLWGVGTKHPNETRHETAMRYILEKEKGGTDAARAE